LRRIIALGVLVEAEGYLAEMCCQANDYAPLAYYPPQPYYAPQVGYAAPAYYSPLVLYTRPFIVEEYVPEPPPITITSIAAKNRTTSGKAASKP
jgi:hypothetical protein